LTGQREARFVREGDWLVVRMSGPFAVEWFVEIIAAVVTALRAAPAIAVFVDAREVFGAPSDLDRYRFAMAAVSQGLTGPLAFLGTEPIVDPARFGEAVARNRGVNARAFTNEVEARAWLREQTGVSPET